LTSSRGDRRARKIGAPTDVLSVDESRRGLGVRILAVVTGAVVALLGLAGAASASTLSVDQAGVLRLSARAGEVNRVTLRDTLVPTGFAFTVSDAGGLTVGRGCSRISATQAQCGATLGGLPINHVDLDLGNRNDSSDVLTLNGSASVTVHGGPGDDHLSGGATVPPGSAYEVDGGSGDDTIDKLSTNSDPIDVEGGPGDDTISTSATVGTGALRGGLGADTILVRSFVFATIDGGPGPDVIKGVATNGSSPFIAQTILGGLGRDTIDGLGASAIDCGAGVDSYVVYDGQTATSCELPTS
jgi:hypothetical protein